MAELEGQSFAGCQIIGKLGQGGFGAVYKARQAELNRFVAIKVLSRELSEDAEYVARFKQEAAAAANLSHTGIVQVYAAGAVEATHYFVMEFVDGESVQRRIDRDGKLKPTEAVAICISVAEALDYAWKRAKLIHRDIKPDNIFLSSAGEVKLGDLGLAKQAGASTGLTRTGTMMGTPNFISPEQAQAKKEIDFRADIYSLGCSLYYMLTGRLPYEGGTDAMAIMHKHIYDPPPAIFKVWPSCPVPLAMLVGKMMMKHPHERFQSYEELIAEMRRVYAKLEEAASVAAQKARERTAPVQPAAETRPAGRPSPAAKPRPSLSPAVLYGGLGAVALSLLIGALVWSPWKRLGSEDVLPTEATRFDQETAKAGGTSVLPAVTDITPPTVETHLPAPTANPKRGDVCTLDLGNSVTMELVGIPPGEFMMGSTKEERAWAAENGPSQIQQVVKAEGVAPRKATIKQGFWLDRTEVTVGQWKQFVEATGYVTDGERNGESYVFQGPGKPWRATKGKSWRDPNFGFAPKDNGPVSCISWNDALAFCEWLNEQEQKNGRLPPGYKVRLPTEAEWEYACRAGTQTKFWWGDTKEDGKDRLNWSGSMDDPALVTPVDHYGVRGRNRFGLADMLGNVREWCLDAYDESQAHEEFYYKGNSSLRVVRGGPFTIMPGQARCAARGYQDRSYANSHLGFRVCVGVDVAGTPTATPLPSPAATAKETGVLAPAETRVPVPTANPKRGDVCTLDLGNTVTLELMGIPPGEFMMGSTPEEQAWAVQNGATEDRVKGEGEQPRKTRIKDGFWLGRTEVTVGQWKLFVAATGYKTDAEKKGYVDSAPRKGQPWDRVDGASWKDPQFGAPPQDNHPVCCVSWKDAMAFCEWLTQRERKAGRLPAGQVVRLPTEAEWEYACRAGTQTKFWWGESTKDGKDRLNWSEKDDGFEYVAPVNSYGERGRNAFGLADMLGNVYEWCLDEYDPTQAHEQCHRGNPRARVLRGGSFHNAPGRNRCAARPDGIPSNSISSNGFRISVGVDVLGTVPSAAPITSREPHVTVADAAFKLLGSVYTNAVGAEMVAIPPGEFLLGSTKEEQAWAVANGLNEEFAKREGESPRKTRIKQGFWLGRTEVTVGQWKQFMAATGFKTDAEKKGYVDSAPRKGQPWGRVDGLSWRDPGFGFAPRDNDAVCCVSWNDAVAFCEWATERERKAGRLAANQVVRLPTEAEWEYACRAGTQTKFWWGDSKEDGKDRLNWSGTADGFEFVSPVDSFGARGQNGFGLADMLGNVYEWCLDEYDAKQAHEECYKGNPGVRVMRGGSFDIGPAGARCAYRNSHFPAYSSSFIGFRAAVGLSR